MIFSAAISRICQKAGRRTKSKQAFRSKLFPKRGYEEKTPFWLGNPAYRLKSDQPSNVQRLKPLYFWRALLKERLMWFRRLWAIRRCQLRKHCVTCPSAKLLNTRVALAENDRARIIYYSSWRQEGHPAVKTSSSRPIREISSIPVLTRTSHNRPNKPKCEGHWR